MKKIKNILCGKIERLTMRYDENGDLKKDLNNRG